MTKLTVEDLIKGNTPDKIFTDEETTEMFDVALNSGYCNYCVALQVATIPTSVKATCFRFKTNLKPTYTRTDHYGRTLIVWNKCDECKELIAHDINAN